MVDSDTSTERRPSIAAEPANVRKLLEQRVQADPDKPFLFSEADARRYTYEEFNTAVDAAAHLLASHAIKKGDVVSLLMPNSVEYIIAYFACWKLGAVAGPVNSLLKPQEMAYVIADSEAKALLYHSQFVSQIQEVTQLVRGLNNDLRQNAILEFDDEAAAGGPYAEFANDSLAARSVPLKSDDDAIIIYTSGTTGKPKGCLLTHGNLIANARQISQWL